MCVCVDQHGQRPPAGIVREFPVSPSETIRAALIAALAVRFGKSLILLPHLVSISPHLEAGSSHVQVRDGTLTSGLEFDY